MPAGYMGKILWVDLSAGTVKIEKPKVSLYKDFVGGYGLGAKIIYDRQKAGADPLGPDNILGLVAGPLTGTPIPAAARYAAVAKSPLTGGWGDANSGGFFGPYLKFAGFDAVFFVGISPKPVYLLIDEGKAEIKDATHLWGKDSYETEDTLMAEYGKQCRVACIGPAGEKLSLISAIMTDKGSAAGRSGLGAVMGSKKLKAVAARGSLAVELADKAAVDKWRKDHIKSIQIPGPGGIDSLHKYGTSALTANSALSGDTPVKNWGGVGIKDMASIEGLKPDVLASYVEKLSGCWRCPIACKATLKEGTEYKYTAGVRRPEYETQASFGANCGNSHTESINMVNDICNRSGLDTISAGSVIAFAIECYENGILKKEDTGGIDLRWGNHKAMVAMTEKMAKREGLGNILADGIKAAAEKIGKGAEKFAVHIGGQEMGMHDPKLGHGTASYARYQMDATPGRHTQGFGPSGLTGHVVNASGMCMIGFGFFSGPAKLANFLNSVTGFKYKEADILKIGERIAAIRHLFNLREGIVELKWVAHPRIFGDPPQKEGPLAGVTIDTKAQIYWNMGALDWDPVTTKPSKKKLNELGFKEIADELWPPQKSPFGPPAKN
ncbi:MAG TPA: aldehyde ferredoxin oxidoreductase family protein [Dehalococcoidales bacterium]|nr:aldehyde ferredoxin oxidoreductase family protein [Dehalococcoidales bacterium]